MQMDEDIKIGILALIILIFWLIAAPGVASLLYGLISGYFAYTGLNALTTSSTQAYLPGRRVQRREESIPQTSSAPITTELTIAERIRRVHIEKNFKCSNCGATIENATDRKCRHCDSVLVDMTALPQPEFWADVEIGQSVRVKHPKRGQIESQVVYRLYYGELWQEKMKKDVPWTLTGNYYTGLGLENSMYLLNWQSRFYLLVSQSPLTDMDINRDFAKYAREFAASNQTKTVIFTYHGNNWKMADIGRFRIEYSEGNGALAQPGAVGRFIHAKADDQILIVEDFQSGGSGRDTRWTGHEITKKDINL